MVSAPEPVLSRGRRRGGPDRRGDRTAGRRPGRHHAGLARLRGPGRSAGRRGRAGVRGGRDRAPEGGDRARHLRALQRPGGRGEPVEGGPGGLHVGAGPDRGREAGQPAGGGGRAARHRRAGTAGDGRRSRRGRSSTRSTTAPACSSSTGWPARTRSTSARSTSDARRRGTGVAVGTRSERAVAGRCGERDRRVVRGWRAPRRYGGGIMRLTVGPLPPAVYWRRRAVVLGAGLLFLIVLLYSCTGSDRNAKKGGTGSHAGRDVAPAPSRSPPARCSTPQTGAPVAGAAPDGR